jgi:hypothetical protein
MGLNVDDYNLVNPTAASGRGQYYDTAGSTLSASIQPKVDGGAMAGSFGQAFTSNLVDGVSTYRDQPDVYGSVMATGTEQQKALTASSNFGTLTAGQYLIVGVTTQVAGLHFTGLRSPGSYLPGNAVSIHQVTNVWTRQLAQALRQGYWNPYTGTFSTAPAAVDDFSAMTTNGTDDAANPSASIPGELVYTDGKPQPVQDDYPARYTY